jgi:hypothetical protein
MELLPTDFEFPKNTVSRSKISVIDRRVVTNQMSYCQWFSEIERKQVKLVSVPKCVPESAAIILDFAIAKRLFGKHKTMMIASNVLEGVR